MNNNNQGILRVFALLYLLAGVYLSPAVADTASNGLFTVKNKPVTPTITAYAQIAPVTTLNIRALTRGTLSQLTLVPGTVVSANQLLARLAGPLIQSELTTRQQNLQKAQAKAHSASQALRITRHKYAAQLTTQHQVDTAISQLAAAKAEVKIATAQLQEMQNMQTLTAPADSIVTSVNAMNGEQVIPDQVIMTLQPTHKLWLRATYYGKDSGLLRIGMTGQFKPADGHKPVAVKLVAIAPNVSSNSGRVIDLVPEQSSNSPQWVNGTWGRLVITGKTKPMASIPTSALILDRGKWWVLLHTPHGDIPREVIPGPAHGWSTVIRKGLKPGEQIVVKNAFLRYHHGIAHAYMPPD